MPLALAGACIGDPPSIGAGETSDGSAGESDSGSTSSVAPTSSADASSTTSPADTSSTGSPCMPGDPACAAPGETIWETLLGEAGHDAAYTLAVDADGNVTIAGEHAAAGGGDPWFARLDADGVEQWSNPTALGEGNHVIRGLALLDGGYVLGVGAQQLPRGSDGYVEMRDAAGATVSSAGFTGLGEDYLISASLHVGTLFTVGFTQPDGAREPTPLFATYTPEGSAWMPSSSSIEVGAYDGVEGQLFDVAPMPNGNMLVVGSLRGYGGSFDAAIQIVTPDGQLLGEAYTFGGPAHDDFFTVELDASGSGVAVGRSTAEDSSAIFMMRFTVADDLVTSQWEHAWTEAPFSYANGFTRDGDAIFVAMGTTADPSDPDAYDAMILRWDGEADVPTWAVPFAADAPHRDYAMDVELAPDGTLIACGVYSPDASNDGNAWVRKLAR